mmetsp:Transcript_22710/g.76629  ORF Transcript_22710/g.76629 Transcript_22710/m.76629 type:complete len:234 (+) Transcript_22710:284-985(+)
MDPRGVRLLGHRLHSSLADLVGRLPSAGRDDAVRLPRLVWIRARGLRAAAGAWPLRDVLPLPVHDAGQAPLHGTRRSRRLVLQVRRHPHQDAAPLQRPHLRLRVQLQGAAPLWGRRRASAGGGRRRRQPRQGGARRGVVDDPAARRRKDVWDGEQAARAAAAAAQRIPRLGLRRHGRRRIRRRRLRRRRRRLRRRRSRRRQGRRLWRRVGKVYRPRRRLGWRAVAAGGGSWGQ